MFADNLVNIAVNGTSYVKYIKTAYDYGKAYISGLNTSTVISNIKATYSCAFTTTVSFKYVKKAGESDSKQVYTFVSTKCEAAVGGMFPEFTYKNGETHPNIVYMPSTNCTSTSDRYNDTWLAAKLYVDPSYYGRFSYAKGINVNGIDGKTIDKYSGYCPSYISQIR